MVRELVGKNPSAHIFHSHSRPYSEDVLTSVMARLAKRCGLKKITAYSYRHRMITAMIKSGESVDGSGRDGELAVTIRRHYADLFANKDALREMLERFNASDKKPENRSLGPRQMGLDLGRLDSIASPTVCLSR